MSDNVRLTGGCQCGAVRYRFSVPPADVSLCHCRMCQKATGGIFGAFAGGLREAFEVTRGALSVFQSSERVERGFCNACGTPLTFSRVGGRHLSVTIGSLDRPDAVTPQDQACADNRLAYVLNLNEVPDRPPIEEVAPELAAAIRASNHQHPDHDTLEWTPRPSTLHE